MIARIKQALWALTLTAMLSAGCTHVPRSDDGASAVTTATADVSFHVQGRFSARHEEKAFVARFDWRHTPNTDEIKLISPLGTTVAGLARVGEAVTVQKGDRSQHTQQVSDWEDLTTQAFGFSLPVKSLAYWIRGTPAPEVPVAVTRDAAGRIESLRQQGWAVQYSYAAAAREPERIDIHYGETVGLRLKIDHLLPLENEP